MEASRSISFRLENVDVVTPTKRLDRSSVEVRDGRIRSLGTEARGESLPVLDGGGKLLLPGIVDLHSDALERVIEPRPGSLFPLEFALRTHDRSLALAGITTIYHCVGLTLSGARKSLLRDNEAGSGLARAVVAAAPSLLVNTRVHLRYDILNTPGLQHAQALIEVGAIDLFSFNDHSPGQGQYPDVDAYRRRMTEGYGRSPKDIDDHIERQRAARETVCDDVLADLAELCRSRGIALASHDDDSLQKVCWAHELGVHIAEFPVNEEALTAARNQRHWIVLGSPNVLQGRSQSGNVSAREAIREGYGDILCSDYSPVSMLHAAFVLVEEGLTDLPGAVRMVSLNPARAAGLGDQTGSIEAGKDADLLLVDAGGPFPHVDEVFVRGRSVLRAGAKLLPAAQPV